MTAPDLTLADVLDHENLDPYGLCDCPAKLGRVAEVKWLVPLVVTQVLSLRTLENGPDDEVEQVDGGMYDGWTFCCRLCVADVLADAKREAVDGTLEVRVSRSWIAQSGQVAA